MVGEGLIETLESRRINRSLQFALKNKESERFKDWFPLADNPRAARETTRRKYKETKARTTRAKNNPLEVMIRQLNEQ